MKGQLYAFHQKMKFIDFQIKQESEYNGGITTANKFGDKVEECVIDKSCNYLVRSITDDSTLLKADQKVQKRDCMISNTGNIKCENIENKSCCLAEEIIQNNENPTNARSELKATSESMVLHKIYCLKEAVVKIKGTLKCMVTFFPRDFKPYPYRMTEKARNVPRYERNSKFACKEKTESKMKKEQQCNQCDFSTKQYKSIVDKVKEYDCNQYDNSGTIINDLKQQKKGVQDKARKYECKHCDYFASHRFHRKHILHLHDQIRRRYDCPQCKHSASDLRLLKLHKENVHDRIRKYKCDECDYATYSYIILHNHKKHVHYMVKYECSFCICSTKELGNLKKHIVWVHDQIRKIYDCPQCTYSASDLRSIKLHTENVHDRIKKYKCDASDYMTYSSAILRRQSKHVNGMIKYKCGHCIYSTMEARKLRWHQQVVHDQVKKYNCKQCDLSTQSWSNLINHEKRVHTLNPRKYKCSFCRISTSDQEYIQQHIMSIHDQIKHTKHGHNIVKYECGHCIYSTIELGNLRRHIMCFHDQIRRVYDCPQCKCSGSGVHFLKYHKENVHDRIKKYKCDKCDYMTYSSAILRKHKKHVHDMVKYECGHCVYSTKELGNLRKHIVGLHDQIKSHDMVKYECGHCIYSTKESKALIRHQQTVHDQII